MLLSEMEIFYNVVYFKSFSKAAEKLNVSKSFISKRISFLENELKTKLLLRSTRNITLTEAGHIFFKQCKKIILEAKKSYQLIDTFHQNPVGTLKISVPIALGLYILPSVLTSFIERYPDIKFNINCENRLVDVIKDGYDLVLRSAKLESSNLIAQKLYSLKNIICASPAYLKKYKNITEPADLYSHHFAIYHSEKRKNELKLIKNNHTYKIILDSSLITNQLDLIKQMVLRGTCLGVLPKFMVKNEIVEKSIIPCLDSYELAPSPIYIVYPNKELLLPKVKIFIKMLKNFKFNSSS
ncbi:MAG: LysR family transcriptional regulator [Gammaproteobacteria bacterium]|nr:LysR family transcriptional regulator [Gammaproteobacteria bacterium]MCW5582678.1 LysR family transcriptional regulator [Gammaproteobacteria bacterium]